MTTRILLQNSPLQKSPRQIIAWVPSAMRVVIRITHIIMKGQWLEAAGFATGCKFDVRVMPGCIVLTAKLPEPEEPELLQSLRRVCKLSARKQQQVQEFIDVISAKPLRQKR